MMTKDLRPGVPVRVAVAEEFADELAGELTIPHVLQTIDNQTDADIAAMLAETDVLVSGTFKASWNTSEHMRLRLVHSVGAGVDGIEVAGLPRGCILCNVYGHERGVAEQAFLLMLALQRDLLQHDRALRHGDWSPQNAYLPELRNRNLLVLGLGHIGAEIVRWGCFLDMNVTVLTRSPDRSRVHDFANVELGSLNDLDRYLKDADFVVVAIPSTPETQSLIGASEFERMKPSAFLINVGRAAVVDEAALYQALKTGSIAGAGLDVWYRYPASAGETCLPANLPFHGLDNIIMTPHKPTVETMQYRWRKIADNIRRFVEGETLDNVVCVA